MNVKNLVLVSIVLLMIMIPSGCACKDGSKSKERKYVNVKDSVGQEQNKDETTFSVSVLKGTSWVADYSDSDREYRIAFTDTTYATSISFVKLKRVYNNIYPFYLSDAVAKSFDEVKVGKNTKGNYLVFYNKNNKSKPVNSAKLSWGLPSKLIMIREGRDTVIFTKCK